MAHLSLPNSELHYGVSFDGHARIEALARAGEVAVLFPGPGAVDASEVAPPRTLIVIDGTWVQAKKVLERSRVLASLPRVALSPKQPGNYRIRKEPAAHCLATIEAVSQVLGELEKAPERFAPMLSAFDRMVDLQLDFIARKPSPARFKRKRHRQANVDPELALLAERLGDVVVLHAEANAYPTAVPAKARGAAPGAAPGAVPGTAPAAPPGPAELVHWVASRLGTGERFEARVRPRRPLGPSVPYHLELPASALLEGESVESALARWGSFVSGRDIFCGWGHYPKDLLAAEGAPLAPYVDLRLLTARRLSRRLGGAEKAAEALGLTPSPSEGGRAGRRAAALAQVVRRLASPELPPVPQAVG